MTKHRSIASLLASGVATLTLDQRLVVPRSMPTILALELDARNIRRDARRAVRKIEIERAGI